MIGTSRNTLAGQLMGRPLSMRRNISKLPVAEFCKATRQYINATRAKPENEALKFYLLEHAVGLVRARREPGDTLTRDELTLLEEYNTFAMRAALRAIHYMFLICCREARHAFPGYGSTAEKAKFCQSLPVALHINEGGQLLNEFPDANDIEAVCSVIDKRCPKTRTIGQLTRFLVATFFRAKFSSSYGGPMWGGVTNCLNEFVHGNISGAVLLDTVWTLEHNTSDIFNKGMMYDSAGSGLRAVLDVQRAGLIPDLFASAGADDDKNGYYVKALLQRSEMRDTFKRLLWLGAPFQPVGRKIDWALVKKLAPNGKQFPKEPEWCVQLFAPPAIVTPTHHDEVQTAGTILIGGVAVAKKVRKHAA